MRELSFNDRVLACLYLATGEFPRWLDGDVGENQIEVIASILQASNDEVRSALAENEAQGYSERTGP